MITAPRGLRADPSQRERRRTGSETRLEQAWETPGTLWGTLSTVDHKIIGRRYLMTALAFLALGGIEAALMRIQLAEPGARFLSPGAYNQLFTLHGITMIWWYAQPVLSAFGNWFVPLLAGTRDMAFPRLNAFSYWAFLASGILLYISVPLGQAPDAGWFAYAPLSTAAFTPALGQDFFALAVVFLTISTTAGAVNFVVTILRLRAPGMTLHRMPLLFYSTLTASGIAILSLPALTAACLMLFADRRFGTRFFDPATGGDPLLWQHLFWFFGHPWVYVVFLPATGMISMLLPVFARRPIVGYAYVAWATVLTGIVGMGVWVHHMFAVGMAPMAMTFFSAASMTLSLFATVQVFAWIATLWLGRPVLTTSLLYALGFIATFVVGGLSGVVTAVIPFDWQVHDTYFVVAHLHYVLIGANLFPVLAALYYWFPKMSGRMLGESLGRWSFGITFIGFHVAFFPMHLAGLEGMRRRVYTYGAAEGISELNLVATLGAFLLAAGLVLTLVNIIVSAGRGARAGRNPWNADTLEWLTESPPASYAFSRLPTVRGRHPLWDDHDEMDDPKGERLFDAGRTVLVTSPLAARPVAVARMPGDSAAPFLLALGLAVIFAAMLAGTVPLAIAAAVAAVAVTGMWLWPQGRKLPA